MASFGDRFIGAMKLDVATFEDVERDTTAIGQSIGVIVIAAVASALGSRGAFAIFALPVTALVSVVGYLAWALAVFLIGTKVMPEPATKSDFAETFRVIGFAAAPGVFSILGVLPLLGILVNLVVFLWMIAAMVVAVRQVLDYTSTGRAVVVCLIGFAVFLILNAILFGTMRTGMPVR